MNEEKKIKCCLALTKIHREIEKGNNKVSWTNIFLENGVNDPNLVSKIRLALAEMKVCKFNGRSSYWSKIRTAPNPKLIDGILTVIKDSNKQVVINKPIIEKKFEILGYPKNTSISINF